MKRLFPFFLVLVISVFPSIAVESGYISSSDDHDLLVQDIFDLIPSEYFGDSSDITPESQELLPPVTNNFVLVDGSPQYQLSDIAEQIYSSLVLAQNQEINEFSEISDIFISPLYTPDQGATVIPSGNLRSVLTSVIGPYSPVVVQYQYTNGTNTQYLREIMPDYVWMISAAMFALVLYCVFRIWGAILCKR